MMLGQIGSVNLHLKNFANAIHVRRCPVEKHGPVWVGSFRLENAISSSNENLRPGCWVRGSHNEWENSPYGCNGMAR
jgi:hypothetical protein